MTLLSHLFVASRPVSWINTAFPFAAAYLLVTREIDLVFIVGTLFFLVPYNLAMYGINDVFDYESDLRNPRKGGAHGAILTPQYHRATLIAAAVLALPFLIVLFWVGTGLSALVLVISCAFVVAYSAPPMRWKEVPFLDSFTSAVHFVSPMVFGYVIGGGEFTLTIVAITIAFLAWGMASHAFGAVQDVVADREGGLASIATVRGARWTVRFALVAYLVAGVITATLPWPGALAAIAVVPYLVIVWPYRSITDDRCEEATRGWRRFLWLNQLAGMVVTFVLIAVWCTG